MYGVANSTAPIHATTNAVLGKLRLRGGKTSAQCVALAKVCHELQLEPNSGEEWTVRFLDRDLRPTVVCFIVDGVIDGVAANGPVTEQHAAALRSIGVIYGD